MRIKHFILILILVIALPTKAQIFNFSLRTNNQQLIDEALVGAFVGINQSYALCDTVKNEHFGRDRKDYFSIISFIGIETEYGLVFPSAALTPWSCDKDFDEYKGLYKPLITETKINYLNNGKGHIHRNFSGPFFGKEVSKHISIYCDSIQNTQGLKVDTVPGVKNGWLIWLSSSSSLAQTDSIRFTSIKKNIEVPIVGGELHLDEPEISETVYGGIYVTPIQSSIGQLTFILTGVAILDKDGWILEFPFLKEYNEKKNLTPISGMFGDVKLNPLKKKRK